MSKLLKNKVLTGAFVMTLAVFAFAFSANDAYAVPKTAASGDWNTPATWTPAGVPLAADDVVIPSGVAVTVAATPATAVNTVTINNAGAATSLTLSGVGTTLTVTGAVTLTAPTTVGATSTLAVGNATLAAGSLSINGGAATFISAVTVSTGNINVTGNISFVSPTTALLTSTGISNVRVGGNFGAVVMGTVTPLTMTLTMNGGAAQIMGVSNSAYNNVVIANTAGGVTIEGQVTIGGTLAVNTGTFSPGTQPLTVTGATTVASGGTFLFNGLGANKTFTGAVTVNSGGIWNETVATAPTFGGSLTNNGTFTASTGIHTFTAVGVHNLAGTLAIPNLDIAGNGVVTNNGTLTVANALSTSATGGFTQGAAGVLNLGGVTNTSGLNAGAAGNIVNYTALGPQTVMASSGGYSNINLSGSGTKTIGAGLTIGANTSIATGVTATLTGASTSNTISLGGVGQAAGTYNNANTPTFILGAGSLVVAQSNAAGQGTASVAPASTVTSTSNTYTVVLTVGAAGITAAADSPTFSIPAGFTVPTATAAASVAAVTVDGNWFVSATGGTCAVTPGTSGATSQVITVDVTGAGCASGNTITLTYKGLAPATAQTATLGISTDDAAAGPGALSIATPPTITVGVLAVTPSAGGGSSGGSSRVTGGSSGVINVPNPVSVGQGLCPNGNSLVSNCTMAPVFVPGLCPNGMTLASNCTSPSTTVINVGGPSGPFSYAFGTATIRRGSSGAGCRAWQNFLNVHRNAGLSLDGKCGPLTMAAATAWQSASGLVADGLLGPKSRAQANIQASVQ